jgi:hypothetical protein
MNPGGGTMAEQGKIARLARGRNESRRDAFRENGPVVAAIIGVTVFLLISSCATSRGTTLDTALAAQSSTGETDGKDATNGGSTAEKPKAEETGLKVSSSPSGAEVWIDGSYRGTTPCRTDDISPGRHLITVRKYGYYESSSWVNYAGTSMTYRVDLVEIVGFLQLYVEPAGSVVSIDGMPTGSGTKRLRIGSHEVSIKAFGYQEFRQSVVIEENAVYQLTVTLSPAAFAITSFTVPKTAVNPENPGLLGYLEIRFSVTGPGSGEITVIDAVSNAVYRESLPRFDTWNQTFAWNAGDSSGRILPDGKYTINLEAWGNGAEPTEKRETMITIDRSLKIAARSLWSGSSGLLYVPAAEALPQGDFQISALAAGIGTGLSSAFQVPIVIGARTGLGNDFELDASGALIASSASTSLKAGIALRRVLSRPRGSFGLASALQAKLSYQYNQGRRAVLLTDSFADFSGLSVELPVKLVLGPAALLFSAGAAGSLWYPYRFAADGSPRLDPVAWLYLRGGISFETGPVVAGISASLRTGPLPDLNPNAAQLPWQAGAEVHWLIPRSRFVLSAIVAGEYEDSVNYYFMGGGGVGFLY